MTEIESYIEHDIEYLKELDINEIRNIIKIISDVVIQGGRIFIAGNGGSAATALHFSTDLKLKNRKLLVTCLNENQPLMTALSNDYSFADVFKLQLEGNFTQNDILIVISASGKSENLINAVEYANQIEAVSIGLLGFDGGGLTKLSKANILIETPKGYYEEVEDIHMILCHIIAKAFGND